MFAALMKKSSQNKNTLTVQRSIIAKPHINLIRKWSSVCDTHSLMRNAAIAKYARVGHTHNMHYHNTAAVKRACMLTNSILVPTKKLDGSYSSNTATPYITKKNA